MLLQTATGCGLGLSQNRISPIPAGLPMSAFLRPLLIALSLLLAGGASGADPLERKDWHRLPPEEREQLRQQMREAWKRLSPEEQEARRQAHRERWNKLSPEEQEAFRERYRQEQQQYLQQFSAEEREALRETMRRQHRKHHSPPEAGDTPWK